MRQGQIAPQVMELDQRAENAPRAADTMRERALAAAKKPKSGSAL